ncbi:MAG TPA: (2Fe-2S)-binding protein [bacterium]|nr:(2Fe-2S)-binding protein [bacterium]
MRRPSEPTQPRETVEIACQVNGRPVRAAVPTHQTLLDLLRDDLNLTGAKRGCDVQVCGACTVLVDGLPVSACTYLAFEIDGKSVETCEGLAHDRTLHPIQRAFVDAGALQCGFCTPGMIMITKALLADYPQPSVDQIKEYLHGNICRCTGYKKIIEAIQRAATGTMDATEPSRGAR